VQAEHYPTLQRIMAGLPPAHGALTIAEGIAVKSIGAIPLAIVREYVSDVILVSEQAIEFAIHLLLEDEKLLAEGAGAAGVAALVQHAERFRNRNVGIILCGGNIDTGLLANVIVRHRLREGRVVRMRVTIDDKPGVLAEVAHILGDLGANILDVAHQRLSLDVPSKNAELDVTVETRSPSDLERIVAKLHESGYSTAIIERR
jgi:threonine dehydratase